MRTANLNSYDTDQPGHWGMYYALWNWISFYEISGDPAYLDRAREWMDSILSKRDDVRDKRDEFRNRVLPAWGTSRFTSGKWHAWAVHNGVICSQLLRYALVVREAGGEAALGAPRSAAAERYVRECKRTVDAFDSDWRNEPDGRYGPKGVYDGYYVSPQGASVNVLGRKSVLPQNMYLGMGLAHIYLSVLLPASQAPKHLDRAKRLVSHFKDQLTTGPNNGYKWLYLENGATIEDTSHGSLTVAFALLANEYKMGVSRKSLERLATTLTKTMDKKDGTLSLRLDGIAPPRVPFTRTCGLWMGLAKHFPVVGETCRRVYAVPAHANLDGAIRMFKWEKGF